MSSGPPQTWLEHWFEHDQLLHLAAATSHVAGGPSSSSTTYTAVGRHRWAADAAKVFDRNSDAFPRRDTHWFRDWPRGFVFEHRAEFAANVDRFLSAPCNRYSRLTR